MGRIGGRGVILIGVSGVKEDHFVDPILLDVRFYLPAGITIGPLGGGFKKHLLSPDKLFYNVGAPNFSVHRRGFRSADIRIHRRYASKNRNTVQAYLFHPYRRFRMPKVDEHTGRTHGPKGSGGNHVYRFGHLLGARMGRQVGGLFGGNNYRRTLGDFRVDFFPAFFGFHAHSYNTPWMARRAPSLSFLRTST